LGLFDEVAELFAQPVKNPAFGHTNGIGGHAELGPDLGRGLLIDCGPPERLPAFHLKLSAQLIHRSADQKGKLFRLLRILRIVATKLGDFLKALLGLGPAGCGGLILPTTKEGENTIASDGAQPTTKRIAGAVAAEAGDVRGRRPEHFLQHVVSVRSLDAPPAAPMTGEWRIQVDHALPARVVAVANALEQAQRRATLVAHDDPFRMVARSVRLLWCSL
jgi:hypothetical protein